MSSNLNLVPVNTKAGDARMHQNVAPRFNKLRDDVLAATGVDFLAKCGDVLRPAGFRSKKDGVAQRSWHKTGRAFDYDQNSPSIVIVGESRAGKQYFRTYLKCKPQDGSRGTFRKVKDYRGHFVTAYLVDFTEMAEAAGFERVPAWAGWQKRYNRREFWHYQRDEGLTWDAAIQQVKDRSTQPVAPTKTTVAAAVKAGQAIVGLNDRGERVKEIQRQLNKRGLLASREIDGVFGRHTLAAVKKFQKTAGLGADGLVGPLTAAALVEGCPPGF